MKKNFAMHQELPKGDPVVDANGFRRSLGQFGTGVTVVTTRHEGQDYGLTSNSFASVSLNPPLVLWSIKKSSQSYEAFTGTRFFAVNVLSSEQIEISNRFAKSGGDKFTGIDFSRAIGECPLVANSLATFECETWSNYDGGDHTIIVGAVRAFQTYDRQALLFSQGQYATADMATFAAHIDERSEKLAPNSGTSSEFLSTTLRYAYGSLWEKIRRERSKYGMSQAQAGIILSIYLKPQQTRREVASKLGFGVNYSEAEFHALFQRDLIQMGEEGYLTLTSSGREKIEDFLCRARELEAVALKDFTSEEIATVRKVLNHLIGN
jgi:4-hydroxyphenylacetate 3-hydroxylase, reductase component